MRLLPPLLGVALAALLASCVASPQSGLRFLNRTPVFQVADDSPIDAVPASRGFPRLRYYFDRFFYRPLARRTELEGPVHAMNVNSIDEVPDSTWFENRIGKLTAKDVRAGPNVQQGPSRDGKWTVTGTKVGGKSAGLLIRDTDGVKYILKFDEPGFAEIETAANVIAQRILWACGFNVPEDNVVFFGKSDLELAPDAVIADTFGNKRTMTAADLEQVFTRVDGSGNGKIRGMTSRFLDGKPLGGAPPEGVREDDPNDVVPHQHRRELRGQYVIFGWLNHTDVKQDNTLDMLVTDERGRKYVRHYLVDFGKALGTAGEIEARVADGFAFLIDVQYILASAFGLGIWRRPWEGARGPAIPGVGRFESARFEPGIWRPSYPWEPFLERDRFDGYWGAKVVAGFSDDMIRAAVAAGQYSDPRASQYVAQTLIERRDKIIRYWFGKVSPLENFEVSGSQLCFRDLAHDFKLRSAERTSYRIRSFDYGGSALGEATIKADTKSAKTCFEARESGSEKDGYTVFEVTPIRGAAISLAVEAHVANGSSARRVIGVVRR